MILFCSIAVKLTTVHLVLASSFQAHLFECFGRKNKKEASQKLIESHSGRQFIL